MDKDEQERRRRAREALFEGLEEQIANPETPEVKQQYHRLRGLEISEPEVRRMMARILGIYFWHTARGDEYSYQDYVTELSTLPESEEEEYRNVLPPKESGAATLRNLADDRFYEDLLFRIESRIFETDRDAQSRSVVINDSQIRSILNKVRKKAEGGTPKVPADSERERTLASLYEGLVQMRSELVEEWEDGDRISLSTRDWLLALRAVEDSVRVHGTGAGSRGYLDFVADFFAEE